MDKTVSILICGVGGQGILLASEVISGVCLKAGYDVRQSEVHGMAQRGGSVISHIRFGAKVYSPIIDPGTADFVVSFELLETLRYAHFAHEGSTIITNTQRILPVAVASGAVEYPKNIVERLRTLPVRVIALDAFSEAKSLGDPRMVNMILVGALSELLPFDGSLWREVLERRLPAKILPSNIKAFDFGRASVQKK
ncbi:MAG: indolepyruvate ferredoxin oxidoreductase beta subunit [Nitrospirae bacterium]|nr:MAG: indolepyruvate ferredoxin oxidoreductase beta subunit [Nitrospirota bacterium]